jgi:hypothetical protein
MAESDLEIDLFLMFFVGFCRYLCGFVEDFVSQVGILSEPEIWGRAGSGPKCGFRGGFRGGFGQVRSRDWDRNAKPSSA